MSLYFSRHEGRYSRKTLPVDEYVEQLDAGTLTPELRQLGFYTYTHNERPELRQWGLHTYADQPAPFDSSLEDAYIAAFRWHWPQVRPSWGRVQLYTHPAQWAAPPLPLRQSATVTTSRGSQVSKPWTFGSWRARPAPAAPSASAAPQVPAAPPVSAAPPVPAASPTISITPSAPSAVSLQRPSFTRHRRHASEPISLASSDMAAPHRRPSLLVNGLPSVQEADSAASTPTAAASAGPPHKPAPTDASAAGGSSGGGAAAAAKTKSAQRDRARLHMMQGMRLPLQYAWTFYHDRHSDEGDDYAVRLTVMLENIISLKPVWETINQFPLERLRHRDAVHFFKRGVRPVWEDPRNARGGSWTFRVAKKGSEELWTNIIMLAVGESFADVIQPKDDLCGVSFSARYNSNLISIWHRDGTAQGTIDGILRVVLAGVSDELRPKEGNYYYKRHSEHAGYAEALAKAKQAAESAQKQAAAAATAAEADAQKEVESADGKIVEAKLTASEVQQAEAEEERARQEMLQAEAKEKEEEEHERQEMQQAGLTSAT